MIHNGLKNPAASVNPPHPSGGAFRIGIVGQIGRWKGHDDLLDAFALVRPKHPQAELHIFGNGLPDYKEELAQRSLQSGIAEGVKWHGFVPVSSDIYSNLDVCVVPSRFEEPFGLTAVEAGMFGLPVIATRRGGLPEIVEQEVNGLLVEAENPTEIAAALCRLIEDSPLRQSLANNARKRATEQFGTERFLQSFLTLLGDGSRN